MINLELSFEEVEKILAALLETPAKYSMDLIINIRSQATEQMSKMNEGEV